MMDILMGNLNQCFSTIDTRRVPEDFLTGLIFENLLSRIRCQLLNWVNQKMKFNSIKNLQLQSTVDILSTITGTVTYRFVLFRHLITKCLARPAKITSSSCTKSHRKMKSRKKCSIKCDGKLIFQFFQENLQIPID